MKIEFMKETKYDGEVLYFTKVDGVYLNNSLKLKQEDAYAIYERVKKANSVQPVTEIVETFDTEQQADFTPYNPEDLQKLTTLANDLP